MKYEDQELVLRAQQGDRQAFDALVLKYQPRVAAIISRYIKDPSEVMDATQDAFMKAYRALPKFRNESGFYTWVYRIAVNTAKNHLVTQSRRPSNFVDEEFGATLSDGSTPEREAQKEDTAGAIRSALADMPEEFRTAIVLREIEGLEYSEIASAMGTPIGTVRSRIFRARAAIGKSL